MKPRGCDANRDVEREIEKGITQIIEDYVDGYELRADRDYAPTEQEVFLIKDCILGLIEEEDFINAFINQHYTPKQDTGFEIVRECPDHLEKPNNLPHCMVCKGTGKITEPLTTIGELVEVAPRMVDALKEIWFEFTQMEHLTSYTRDLNEEALTYKGGRIRRV